MTLGENASKWLLMENLEHIPLDKLEGHPENRPIDPAHVERLAESISLQGLAQPLFVRPLLGGTYQIIAGHHRHAALLALRSSNPGEHRFDLAPCVVRDLADPEARSMLVATNLLFADYPPEKRGAIYQDFYENLVPELRRRHPERYRGVASRDIIVEVLQGLGFSTSASTVERDRRTYRESLSLPTEIAGLEGASRAQKQAVSRLSKADRDAAVSAYKEGGADALECAIALKSPTRAGRFLGECSARAVKSVVDGLLPAARQGYAIDEAVISSLEDALAEIRLCLQGARP